MNPMLADDWNEAKLQKHFNAGGEVGVQPKIDGVRGLSTGGAFTGRSLKAHENRYTTAFFSRPEYADLDGELAAEHECNPDLCRITSSACSTHEGQPYMLWHVFDYLPAGTALLDADYKTRYAALKFHVAQLQARSLAMNLRVVPMHVVKSMEELLHWDNLWLSMGYEGTIVRGLDKKHKQGRSSPTQLGLLRIKRFIDFECVVTKIVEGEQNDNEAQVNELGNTFRSTHQENMVPNGMVGSMDGYVLKDVLDPNTKKLLLFKGQIVTVSPGRMTHDMRKHYFANPHELLNHIVKSQFFPKGLKDKPRFPTYQSHRAHADISEG